MEAAVNVAKQRLGVLELAKTLGHELVQQGQRVLWTTTLVPRLLTAKRDLRLPQALAQLDCCACLILDDIGYVQHDRDEMEMLFTPRNVQILHPSSCSGALHCWSARIWLQMEFSHPTG